MQSDGELIEQIRERNTTAFEALFERYRHAVHKHLLGIVRDESAAEIWYRRYFFGFGPVRHSGMDAAN